MKWPVIPMVCLVLAGLPACRTVPPAPLPKEADSANVSEDDEAYKEIRLFTAALLQIRKGYVDESKTSYKDLVHSGLKGMLGNLDPHSQFLEPQAYQQIKDDTTGEFSGIGIVLGSKDNVLTVISPIEDSPAFKAGVQAGEKIIEVDGQSTEGLTVNDAIKKLRGEKGTSVKLKLLGPGSRDFHTVDLVRDVIRVTSVKGARLLDADSRIGYIRITQFTETSADDLETQLQKMTNQNMRALILDLRNNPGGLLTAAVNVSELFLEKGKDIVSTRGRPGTPNPAPIQALGNRHYLTFPMAILINGGSASASEIVSGALQDHKRAVLVGDTTFGKASVQSVLALDEQTAIRLTTAYYYTPSGRLIHDLGIQPDIVAPIPPDMWQKIQLRRLSDESPGSVDAKQLEGTENIRDLQLDRAVDLLKGILVFQEKR